MKQLLLLLLIFGTGTTLFCSLRQETIHLRETVSKNQIAAESKEQLIAQMRVEREQLVQQIRDTKRQLASARASSNEPLFNEEAFSKNGWKNLSPDQAEKLLAELGFNWNSTGDFLIVSKKTLDRISFDGMKNSKLTKVAREVLAITPDEQSKIEAVTQQLETERADWVRTHAQREEPSGDVLAKYTLPFDVELSQSRSNTFVTAIHDALGNERGELLQHYAYQWMQGAGMLDSPSPIDVQTSGAELTLTRNRPQDGTIGFTLKQANSTMSTVVSPWQPFPDAFKPLFPDGWPDLAARESFELPESFKKKKGQ
jgi:hypothetical protein